MGFQNLSSNVPQQARSGQMPGSFSTTSTTLVTALNITGKGRLIFLTSNNTNVNQTIKVTIDGNVICNQTNGFGPLYINPLGNASSVEFDMQFNQSLKIEISTASAAYQTTATWAYEKE